MRLKGGVDLWSTYPDKGKWSAYYQAVEGGTQELSKTITYLQLLRYLPGVCSVCNRFDV